MNVLHDAIKEKSCLRGRALLRWDFKGGEFPGQSLNMPEPVVDQILKWRDRDAKVEAIEEANPHDDTEPRCNGVDELREWMEGNELF